MESTNEIERAEQQQRESRSELAHTVGTETKKAISKAKNSPELNAKTVGEKNTKASNTPHTQQPLNWNAPPSTSGVKIAGENTAKVAGQVMKNGSKAAKVAKTAGTALASGAATGGIGTVVTLTIAGLKAIRAKVNTTMADMAQPTDVQKEATNPIILIIVAVVLIMCILVQIVVTPVAVAFYPMMTAFEQVTDVASGLVQKAKVSFVGVTDKGKYFKELFGVEKYDVNLDRKISEEMQIDENNVVIYKKMIDDAIYRCFAYYVTSYAVNALNIQNDVTGTPEYSILLGAKSVMSLNPFYAVEEAMEAFRAMRYPYTLAHKDGFYYTIGDYLDKNIPEEELNNDVNYAEIIAVICQNENFQDGIFTYEDMYNVLMGDKVASLLFEMKFFQSPVFCETPPDEIKQSETPVNTDENTTEKIESVGYYYPSEIAPYGLNELYDIANVNPYRVSLITESMRNIEILNDQESWIRARFPEIDLGPAWNEERASTSLAAQYQKAIDKPVSGRSCMDYLNGESITEMIINQEHIQYKNQDVVDTINKLKFTPTGESVILDFPIYINQGNYPNDVRGTDGQGETIKKSGCIDCAYAMIEMYYNRNTLSMPEISAKYVRNNQFQPYQFMEDYGLSFCSSMFESGNSASDQPFNLNIITASITQGYPVVLHIKGHWQYDGRVYHQSENGHFLTIIGYDANGLYVYDPGSQNNTENGPIPYDAFNAISYKELRYVFPVDNEFVPWYRVNTIRDGKVE